MPRPVLTSRILWIALSLLIALPALADDAEDAGEESEGVFQFDDDPIKGELMRPDPSETVGSPLSHEAPASLEDIEKRRGEIDAALEADGLTEGKAAALKMARCQLHDDAARLHEAGGRAAEAKAAREASRACLDAVLGIE